MYKRQPVDQDSAAARKRRERALRRAVPFLRDSLKQVGLDDELEVTTKWLKRSQLDDVRRTLERGR